jgi:hypothetical protein
MLAAITTESTYRPSWWRRLFEVLADNTRGWRRGVGL